MGALISIVALLVLLAGCAGPSSRIGGRRLLAWGTNNLARSSSWSGRVVTKGNSVILEDAA